MRKKISILFILAMLVPFNVDAYADEFMKTTLTLDSYMPSDYSAWIDLTKADLNEAYQTIYTGLVRLDDTIDISEHRVSTSEISDIYFKVLADNPQIFYAGGLTWSYNPATQIVANVKPQYIYSKSEILSKGQELDSEVDRILASIIRPNMSEFERELAIHDYIVLNTQYDRENYNNKTVPKDSYNAYGTLVKGLAVCEGYSKSMQLLLDRVGIQSIIVSSPYINHAWNIVTIDKKDYHVDATWNDPTPDRKNRVSYKYLNLPDSEMKKDHIWDYDLYPKCNDHKYSDFWEMDSPVSIEDHIYYSRNLVDREYIYRFDVNYHHL